MFPLVFRCFQDLTDFASQMKKNRQKPAAGFNPLRYSVYFWLIPIQKWHRRARGWKKLRKTSHSISYEYVTVTNAFAVEFDFLRSSSVLMWLETNSDTLLIQKTLKTDSLHSFASPWPNDKPKEDSQTRGQPNLGGRPKGLRATCINLDLHDNERRWKWKRSKLLVSFNTVVWATYQNMLRIY